MLKFRPLSEADFPWLVGWLNEPHLRPFYQDESINLEQLVAKYAPRLSPQNPCHCLIGESAGMPFGFLQWYRNSDFPDYGIQTIGEPAGISLDYFIGARAFLGRGLGAQMLAAAVRHISEGIERHERVFFVGHHVNNKVAIACAKSAGFDRVKEYTEQGAKHVLLGRGEAS